jgi:hypothetical protein
MVHVVSRRPINTNNLVGYQGIQWHWEKIFFKHSEFSLSVPLHQGSKFVFKFKIPQELYIWLQTACQCILPYSSLPLLNFSDNRFPLTEGTKTRFYVILQNPHKYQGSNLNTFFEHSTIRRCLTSSEDEKENIMNKNLIFFWSLH